ncbi:hypothetical protein Tco_0056525 [Tanacetum coccineum]
MLSPQGAVRLWKNLRLLLFLHPFLNPQQEPEQNPETSTEKVQNPNLKNTAHVPSPGEEHSIFIEIPKPKAKKTVSLDPNPNSYPSKLPYPERMKVREHDKPSAQHSRFLKMFKQLRLEIGLKNVQTTSVLENVQTTSFRFGQHNVEIYFDKGSSVGKTQ